MPLHAVIADGRAEFVGALDKGCRSVYVQWRDRTDEPWTPPLGTQAAIGAGRARTMLERGPWKHLMYRLVEVASIPTPVTKEALEHTTRTTTRTNPPGSACIITTPED